MLTCSLVIQLLGVKLRNTLCFVFLGLCWMWCSVEWKWASLCKNRWSWEYLPESIDRCLIPIQVIDILRQDQARDGTIHLEKSRIAVISGITNCGVSRVNITIPSVHREASLASNIESPESDKIGFQTSMATPIWCIRMHRHNTPNEGAHPVNCVWSEFIFVSSSGI